MSDFNSNYLYLLIIGIVSGLLIIKKIKSLSAILILVTFIIGYSITSNFIIALSVSLILGNIYVSLNKDYEIVFPGENRYYSKVNNSTPGTANQSLEVFCGRKSCKKNNIESRNIKRSLTSLIKPNQIEKFSNNKGNTKKNNDDIVEKMSNESDTSSIDSNSSKESKEKYFIDSKGSFLDNYNSLSKKQLKGLNKDTRNLIKTQKQLIETLNNMGPALKDGKEILDSFKNYFGSESKLGSMLSNMKI